MEVIDKSKNLIYIKFFTAIFILLALIGAFNNYSSIPFGDMWDGYLDFYTKVSHGDLGAWWGQHNEHRIVLARILFWIDITFFQGQSYFLIICNYIFVAFSSILVWKSWKEKSNDSEYWLGYFLVAWCFSWCQHENLIWAFQSQFFLAQLLPLYAFYLLHKSISSAHRSNFNFALSVAVGVISIASMANGILALPLMLVFAIFFKFNRIKIALLAVSSVITIGAYFYDYHAIAVHGSLITSLKSDPIGLIEFVFYYLGSPFYYFLGHGKFGVFGALIAGVFLVISTILFFVRLLNHRDKSSLNAYLILFIIYISGTAFGTAGGRLIFGVGQAFSSRYTTPALLAWACLIILYIPTIKKLRTKFKGSFLRVGILLLSFLFLQQFIALRSHEIELFERKLAALSVSMGIKDKQQVESTIFPSVDWIFDLSIDPIRNHISIFGANPFKDAANTLGRNSTAQSLNGYQCMGALESALQIEGNSEFLSVKGWIYDATFRRTPKSVTLINKQDIVGGFAITGLPKFEQNNFLTLEKNSSVFKGYVSAKEQGQNIQVVDMESGCYFNTVVPEILFSNASADINKDIPTVKFSQVISGNQWLGSDYDKTTGSKIVVLGSLIHSDEDTGSIVLKIKRGDTILYRSGPTMGRQIAEVINQPQFTTYLPLSREWVLLKFSNPKLPENFELKLSDKGKNWGEWSAIGLAK